jgi:hypothetical protein
MSSSTLECCCCCCCRDLFEAGWITIKRILAGPGMYPGVVRREQDKGGINGKKNEKVGSILMAAIMGIYPWRSAKGSADASQKEWPDSIWNSAAN